MGLYEGYKACRLQEVKKTALGLAMQLNDPLGRKLIVGGYKLAQKLFGFN